MGYHIINIDSPNCSLSCKDGQLTCRTAETTNAVPIEDVAAVIITSFSASLHSKLLVEAARAGVAFIICESFQPVSLVLPANRSTDTHLTRAQVNLKPLDRSRLWEKTLTAKCLNQHHLAATLVPDHPDLPALEAAAKGKNPHRESICARYFWKIYSNSLGIDEFKRTRTGGTINPLLNYGYAVLLSTVLQKLFAVGIDPTFGIEHVTRERSAPLAYDLMEPFRPCVDWRVAQWVEQCRETGTDPFNVTKPFRAWVTGFPLEKIEHFDLTLEIRGVIEGVLRSFRKSLIAGKTGLYRPWTQKNSKWAG